MVVACLRRSEIVGTAQRSVSRKNSEGWGESVETLSLPLPPLSLSSSSRSLNSRHSPLAESLEQAMVLIAGTMNAAASKKQTFSGL